MENKKFFEKFKESKIPWHLIAIILVLIVLSVFAYLNQPKKANETVETDKELVLAKQVASESHNSIETILNDSKALAVTDSNNAILKQGILDSMKSELEWLYSKEKPFFEETQSTKSIPRATELAAKEVSILILANFIIEINAETFNDISNSNAAEAINLAKEELNSIKLTEFLSEDILQDPQARENLSAQLVKENFYKFMDDYLGLKKEKFSRAGNETEKLVEAGKLLELKLLFESV